jgi:hypothetical protein
MSANAFRAVLVFALLAASEWWVKLELLAPILWPPTYTATALIELPRPPCPSFSYPIIRSPECPGEPVRQ